MESMSVAAGFMLLLLLLVPVIAGVVVIVMSRRRGKGYPACGKCGYDVSGTLGTTTARCPECGSDFGVVGIMPATPQTNKAGLWIGIAMVVVPLLCVGGMMLSTYFAIVEARQASQAAMARQMAAAAAIQQQQRQAILAALTADPTLVATFVPKAAAMTMSEAAQRQAEITQEISRRATDQTLDAQAIMTLKAELQAIEDRLSTLSSPTSSQP